MLEFLPALQSGVMNICLSSTEYQRAAASVAALIVLRSESAAAQMTPAPGLQLVSVSRAIDGRSSAEASPLPSPLPTILCVVPLCTPGGAAFSSLATIGACYVLAPIVDCSQGR